MAINLKTTRINYPFGYWNSVGCWSAMTITLCLAYAGHARSALVRGLALAAVPMCSVGLYLALSRAGVGGAIIGAVVVTVLAEWRWLTFVQTVLAAVASLVVILAVRAEPAVVLGTGSEGAMSIVLVLAAVSTALGLVAWLVARAGLERQLRMERTRGRRLGFVAVIVAVVVLVALASVFGGRAYDQFIGKDVVVTTTSSDARLAQLNGNRHNLWDSAWDAFTAHPITGTGPGTFEFWWSRNGSNGEFVRDVHNVFLEALAETGVVGLALLLMLIGGLFWSAWRPRAQLSDGRSGAVGIHAGLIAVFVVFVAQAAFDWMWESTAITVFALVAVAAAAASASPRKSLGNAASTSVGLLIVAFLAVVVMLPGLASQRQIDKSQAAFRGNDFVAAREAADDAVRAQSWSATAYGQLALALEAEGELTRAREAIDLAQQKEPTNWRWPLVALKIAVAAGDVDAAVAARRRAIKLRRFSKALGQRSPKIR
ncbi:MAG: O-antigen ligase family protein [Thermoleophilaceae bacterium]|nr:O-antigen ligase family protein [Thermoleophilaceae bacterium]